MTSKKALLTRAQAIKLLKKYSTGEKSFEAVLSHSLAVEKSSIILAKHIEKKQQTIDFHLLSIGAILHDIGRFSCPPKTPASIQHGVKGAEILEKEGFEKLARIAETHIGSGLDKDTAEKLGLPKRDMNPKTVEEKIICLADTLVFGTRIGSFEEAVERYRKEVGNDLAEKTKKLKQELYNPTN
ncbi:MAG: HDIG domain-containing protein [Candidatus Diapherotrites archaeon]|nr:HDIG domain-containing protein [Candidatus Diapherotrites archaeon]